jgi:hypothetical protein
MEKIKVTSDNVLNNAIEHFNREANEEVILQVVGDHPYPYWLIAANYDPNDPKEADFTVILETDF